MMPTAGSATHLRTSQNYRDSSAAIAFRRLALEEYPRSRYKLVITPMNGGGGDGGGGGDISWLLAILKL